MSYRLLLVLILSGLVVVFIIQNVAVVEIQFLFWATQMPRSLLIFLVLAIGIIIGWFLHGYVRHRAARHNSPAPSQPPPESGAE